MPLCYLTCTLPVFLGFRSGQAAVFVLLGHALCDWVIDPRRFETAVSKRREPISKLCDVIYRKPLVFLSSLLQKAHLITLSFFQTNIYRAFCVYYSCIGLMWILHRVCFANYKQGYLLFVRVRVVRRLLHLRDVSSGVPRIFVRGNSTNSVEERENGDLGAVAS